MGDINYVLSMHRGTLEQGIVYRLGRIFPDMSVDERYKYAKSAVNEMLKHGNGAVSSGLELYCVQLVRDKLRTEIVTSRRG